MSYIRRMPCPTACDSEGLLYGAKCVTCGGRGFVDHPITSAEAARHLMELMEPARKRDGRERWHDLLDKSLDQTQEGCSFLGRFVDMVIGERM